MEKSITRKDAYIVRVEGELEKAQNKLKELAETSEKSYVCFTLRLLCTSLPRASQLIFSSFFARNLSTMKTALQSCRQI